MDVKLRYELDLAPESRWNILSSTAAAKNALLYAQEAGDFYAGKDYYTTRQGAESYLPGGAELPHCAGRGRLACGLGAFLWCEREILL